MSDNELFAVFDCESVGLHGETFAVGLVVVDAWGNEQTLRWPHGMNTTGERLFCDPDFAQGNQDSLLWVRENVPLDWIKKQKDTMIWRRPRDIRQAFWNRFEKVRALGASFWVDCGWPVEARFLADCIKDDETRQGPYPLYDLSVLRWLYGEEIPVEQGAQLHDPLTDARRSARLLVHHLQSHRDWLAELDTLRSLISEDNNTDAMQEAIIAEQQKGPSPL